MIKKYGADNPVGNTGNVRGGEFFETDAVEAH
jgi:hypothetical protein